MKERILLGILLGGLGCSETEKEISNPTDGNQQVEEDQGEVEQDPQDTSVADDEVIPTDAPQITSVSGFFTTYQGVGDIVEIHISYVDAQDDLLDGILYLSYSTSGESNSYQIPIDGAQALLDDGEVIVLFTDVNTSLEYVFTVQLEDVAGNQSEQEDVTVSN